MNGLSSLIWVTCSWIASHLASSGAPETSTQVVISSSGTSILAANSSNSAICSGVASSGGDQHGFWPELLHPLVHPLADRRGDRLDVELRRRPRLEPGLLELLRVPGRVAGPLERPDRDVVGPDVVGMAVAAELVVGRDDVRLVAAGPARSAARPPRRCRPARTSADRGCRRCPSSRSRGSRGSPTRSRRGGPSPARARRPGSRPGGGGCRACPCRGRRSRRARRASRSRGPRDGRPRRPWPSPRRSRSSRRRDGRGRSSRSGGGGAVSFGHGLDASAPRTSGPCSRAAEWRRRSGHDRSDPASPAGGVLPADRAGTDGPRSTIVPETPDEVAFVAYGEDCILSGRTVLDGDRLTRHAQRRTTSTRSSASPSSGSTTARRSQVDEVVVARDELWLVHASGPRGDVGAASHTAPQHVAMKMGPYEVRGFYPRPARRRSDRRASADASR